jgi:hypothetical protein
MDYRKATIVQKLHMIAGMHAQESKKRAAVYNG